jgi:predicted RNase H-like nuclease (RuvC/YqgF family)
LEEQFGLDVGSGRGDGHLLEQNEIALMRQPNQTLRQQLQEAQQRTRQLETELERSVEDQGKFRLTEHAANGTRLKTMEGFIVGTVNQFVPSRSEKRRAKWLWLHRIA